jgi:hypothetical protein
MGQREENGIRLGDGLIDREAGGGEVGVDGLDGLGASTSPGETDQLHGWMPSQDADQLGSGVSSCAHDGDADSRVGRAVPATRPDRRVWCSEASAHGRLRPLTGGRLDTEPKPGWIAVMTV